MPAARPITIIGGGLAGLALGIGLRRHDVPVTVWEAGSYPRHRVCGEFISGRGQAVLEQLGLLERCRAAGAVEARTAVFFCGRNRTPVRELGAPALCLSRYTLDGLLARMFQEAGGELRVNSRWTGSEGEGVVQAGGRRLRPGEGTAHWFGLKAHIRPDTAVPLTADLEMHITRGGYVGINRIGGGEINVCGLVRGRPGGPRFESKLDWLCAAGGLRLRERLGQAQFDPASICSVAGLELNPRRAEGRPECCIGDALTMTPPVTGNGMSMAFESAAMAIDPLVEYSRGRAEWPAARAAIARTCDAAFGRRLAWARRLQVLVMSPVLRSPPGRVLLQSAGLWQFLYARTRQ